MKEDKVKSKSLPDTEPMENYYEKIVNNTTTPTFTQPLEPNTPTTPTDIEHINTLIQNEKETQHKHIQNIQQKTQTLQHINILQNELIESIIGEYQKLFPNLKTINKENKTQTEIQFQFQKLRLNKEFLEKLEKTGHQWKITKHENNKTHPYKIQITI